ncbi:MAG: Asp-tRNA(Asn)/Glu-tRNA(Gln) amidotransferase subunit GatB, partial [Dehalococcoidia bacterium]
IKLQQILRYLGASRANMEEGNMRCEPNVSVRPRGTSELGAKVELKNINSFRHAYDAIKYEVQRQIQLLSSGGRVAQETRGWREDSGEAVSQRSKEFSHDYRYFPEPDLPPLIIDREWVEEIRRRMPELPDAKKARFRADYGLSDYDATLLTESRARADFFESVVALAPAAKRKGRAKAAANWIGSDFAGLLNAHKLEIDQSKVTPQALAELIDLLDSATISSKIAKTVFEEMFESGRPPKQIVQERGLVQITAADEIEAAVTAVLAANPKAAADYQQGKQEALKFLVGQVMRETEGRANPALVNELLLNKLTDRP